MKKQTVTKVQVLLKTIAMIMVFVMTITCMDLYVPATTLSSSQETTMRVETEIETTSQANDEVSSKSVLNRNVGKQEVEVNQEKIDSSLQREDPLAGKIARKNTESEEETIKKETKEIVSLPEKSSEELVLQNQTQTEDNERDYEPGVVIVGFKKSYTEAKIVKQFPKLKIKSTENQDKLLYEAVKLTSNYKKSRLQKIEEEIGTDFVIELKEKTKESVIEAIKILEKDDNVEYAIPNYVLEPAVTPNDSYYSNLWGMNRIQAPQAWDTYKGSNTVTVGIVDTGIDTSHTDLEENINTQLAYNAHTKTSGNAMDYRRK